jgi:hypothetical protein
MGIAMSHFELACLERGLAGGWVLDQPAFDDLPAGLQYTVSWTPPGAVVDRVAPSECDSNKKEDR